MSAPAGYQKGSFRGLPFVTLSQEQTGGRRGVLHELPNAELPVWEDLGRKGARFTISCVIRGATYLDAADAFGTALSKPGVGTLIHPWLGSMQVIAETWTRSDDTSEGGQASFSIEFLETGLPALPQPAADTPAQARAAAAVSEAAAPEQFADRFDLTGVQAFVEDNAAQLVTRAATAMAIVSGLQGGIGPALRAIQANLGVLPPSVQALLRSPADLGLAIVGAVESIAAISGGGVPLIGGLALLLDFGADLPAITGDTPARDRQRENEAAIVQLVNLAAAAAMTRAIADTGFASYQEAVAVRDAAADALDALELRQADAGDDDGAAGYRTLRQAIVSDVTARGGTLARLQAYTPAITEPAIVIAHRLYGPSGVEAAEAELVGRNRIAHPGFVPGGTALQVVTPAQAIGVAHG